MPGKFFSPCEFSQSRSYISMHNLHQSTRYNYTCRGKIEESKAKLAAELINLVACQPVNL